MRILAIDPGYGKCGFAIINHQSSPQYVTSGLIRTPKTTPAHDRLHLIYDRLAETIQTFAPTTLAIEKLFFSKNTTTALGVSQSVGIVMLLAAQHQLTVLEFTPNQIKQVICGYGNADKQAVQKMLWLQLGQEIRVGDDDESDAIACGLTACLYNPALA